MNFLYIFYIFINALHAPIAARFVCLWRINFYDRLCFPFIHFKLSNLRE